MSIDNFDKDNLEIKDLLEEKEFVYKDEKTGIKSSKIFLHKKNGTKEVWCSIKSSKYSVLMRGDGSIKVCHQDPPMYVDWDTKELVYPLFGSRYNNKQLGEPQIKHVKDRERYINLLKFGGKTIREYERLNLGEDNIKDGIRKEVSNILGEEINFEYENKKSGLKCLKIIVCKNKVIGIKILLENEEHLVLMNVKEDGEYNRERIIKEGLNYRCDKEMFKAIVRDIHLIINKYEDEQK